MRLGDVELLKELNGYNGRRRFNDVTCNFSIFKMD